MCDSTPREYWPTRVIEVGDPHGGPARLVRLQDMNLESTSPVAYAALSHCWGLTTPTAILTEEVLPKWLLKIELQTLPKTFLDAIRIAQKLEIQYLWIDCMCIIQDNKADWQKEAAHMADIYQNAYLTIAAASSVDSKGGCSIEPLDTGLREFTVQSSDADFTAVVRPWHQWEKKLAQSPLYQRGWILQEQILSKRCVYFTDSQMYWQCHSKQYSEDGLAMPCQETMALARNNFMSIKSPSDIWWKWIQAYASRRFTYSSDKLAAFAGVTKMYQDATGHYPLVGLWQQSIMNDLLWSVRNGPKVNGVSRQVSVPPRFPSWSWVAAEGTLIPPSGFYGSASAKLVDSDVIWSREPLTSPLVEAKLTLFGQIQEMKDHLHLTVLEDKCELDQHYPLPDDYPAIPSWRLDSAKPTVGSAHHVILDYDANRNIIQRRFHSSLGLESTSTGLQKDAVLHGPQVESAKCPLTTKHGSSSVKFDYEVPPDTPIYGFLLYGGGRAQEQILLLTPLDNRENHYRRLGIAMHTHTSLGRTYCDSHGWPLKEFTPGDHCRKMCSRYRDLGHEVLSCFKDAQLRTVHVV